MKKVISVAVILLAAFVALPSVAQTRTKSRARTAQTVKTPTPVDKMVDYLNSIVAQMRSCTSPYESQAVLNRMDPAKHLDLTDADFDYKMSTADKQKLTDAMANLVAALASSSDGEPHQVEALKNQMNDFFSTGISKATTLKDAFVNMGMRTDISITGR